MLNPKPACIRPAVPVTGLSLLVALLSITSVRAASPDNELAEGIRSGDAGQIKEAIAAGARLNTTQGSTALMLALSNNFPAQHPGIVELLVENGADINLPDRSGMTPFLQAIEAFGDESLLETMISRGAKTTAVSRDGQSAVGLSAQRGWIGLTRKLLELGSPPDVPTREGRTALMSLSALLEWNAFREEEAAALATALIAKGADPTRTDASGKSAADEAFEQRDLALLKVLDTTGKYRDRYESITAEWQAKRLGTAILAEKPAEVRRLLDAGADPNGIFARWKTTMLGLALQNRPPFGVAANGPEIVAALLAKGANPNAPISPADLPLTAAVANPKAFQLLLDHGADPSAATEEGLSAIHKAAIAGALPAIEILLAHGIKVDATSRGGTPLLWAITNGRRKAVTFLIEKGANLAATTPAGQTAADLAASLLDIDLLRALDKEGKYSALLAEYSPPKDAPIVGDWLANPEGTEIAVTLLPNGGGSIGIQGGRPIAWKAGGDAYVLVTSMPPDERFPQPRKLFASAVYDATTQTVRLAFGGMPGETLLFLHRPGTPVPASPVENLPPPGITPRQQIAVEIARARISPEPAINLTGAEITAVPDGVFGIVGLQRLMIQNAPITRLPGRLGQLVLLNEISAMGNRIDTIEDGVFDLVNLQQLDLSRNRLKTVPEKITTLSKLADLNLWENRIVSLPEGWEKMTVLHNWAVADNWLKVLPASIARAPALDSIEAGNNMLVSLPPELARAERLRTLSLPHNRFATFPDVICKLDRLEFLDLSGNDIAEVPTELAGMTGLKRLMLSENRLTAIPAAIKKSRVVELNLSGNKIASFPANADAFPPSLESLDLQNNDITEIPEWIDTLNLRDIRLRGNPMSPEKIRALEDKVRDTRRRKR